ncbi:unnamed protein product [Peniophora sp. CBMAI 1063]|nr:unnamed protein product [Peniophora sp. CBMAI 1063]
MHQFNYDVRNGFTEFSRALAYQHVKDHRNPVFEDFHDFHEAAATWYEVLFFAGKRIVPPKVDLLPAILAQSPSASPVLGPRTPPASPASTATLILSRPHTPISDNEEIPRLSQLISYQSIDPQHASIVIPPAFADEVAEIVSKLQHNLCLCPQPLPPYVEENPILFMLYTALGDVIHLSKVASEHLVDWAHRRLRATSLEEATLCAEKLDFFEGEVAFNDRRLAVISKCLTRYDVSLPLGRDLFLQTYIHNPSAGSVQLGRIYNLSIPHMY